MFALKPLTSSLRSLLFLPEGERGKRSKGESERARDKNRKAGTDRKKVKMKRKEEGRRVRKERTEKTREKESMYVKDRNKSTYHGAEENIGIVLTPSTAVVTFSIQFFL